MTKTLRLPKKQLLLLLVFFAMHGIFAQTIRYVNASLASGSNNGTSWANAYINLQSALATAQAGDQIWVAKGTYYPTPSTTDRTASFVMKDNVAIYGGFAGTETVLSQRNWTTNVTTLSGDIDHTNDPLVVTGNGSTLSITGNMGNSYCIITCYNLSKNVILDGFTLTGANGNLSNEGGAIIIFNSSPSLSNLIFFGNHAYYGGGLNILDSSPTFNSSPILVNVTFLQNSAQNGGGMRSGLLCFPTLSNVRFLGNIAQIAGGGMENDYGFSVLSNVVFIGNFVQNGNGGGMSNSNSSSTLSNVLFEGNTSLFGSGMENYNSSPLIINATFFGNNTQAGSNIDNFGSSSPTITNCLIWSYPNSITNRSGASATITYSNIQGGYSGTGNINQNPLFVNAANPAGADGIFGTRDDGLVLQLASPCINTGSNAALPAGDTTDIIGSARIQQGVVDMGAYEFNLPSPTAFANYTNTNLIIARPGNNIYNNEPVSFYTMDTATGAATLLPGGALKDSLTGTNIDMNGVGLNVKDGFAYGIRDSINPAGNSVTPIFYRLGSNSVGKRLLTIQMPFSMMINPASGTFDDNDTYYFIGVTGTNIGSTSFKPQDYYLCTIQNVSKITGNNLYLTSYALVSFTGIDCGAFRNNLSATVSISGPNTGTGIQDIAYSKFYKSVFLYEAYQSPAGSGNYVGQMISVNPSATYAGTCYPTTTTIGALNNEVAGISTTASGNLRILMTGGDIYKADIMTNGYTGAIAKVGASGITGGLRGDLASSSVGPLSLPSEIQPLLTAVLPNQIVAYPNPVRGITTITTANTLTNATVTLIGLAGNIISQRTGVSGNSFQMDMTSGASGMYMIEINQNGNISRVKVLKQ